MHLLIMKVDDKLISKVAEVARLKLTKEEEGMFVKDFKEILDAFSVLDKCDTKGVEVSAQPLDIKVNLREDKVEPSFTNEEALTNAKHKRDSYFKGPKAV